MIRATWDTNVLASSAIAREGSMAMLFSRWRANEFELVVFHHIVQELARVLGKSCCAERLVESDRAAFLALVSADATIVEITAPVPDAVSDPADHLVLATALSARTPFLVSGDRELQDLGDFAGITIVPPAQFLAVLDAER